MPNFTTKDNIEAWSKNSEKFDKSFFNNYKEEGDFWHRELINPNILNYLDVLCLLK